MNITSKFNIKFKKPSFRVGILQGAQFQEVSLEKKQPSFLEKDTGGSSVDDPGPLVRGTVLICIRILL
jgi:hypothetical protein